MASPWLFFAIEVARFFSTSRKLIKKEIMDRQNRGERVLIVKYWYYE